MGWSCVYKLPWPALDRARIEDAIEAVFGALPYRPRTSEFTVRNRRSAIWNIEFFPDEEREWSVLGDPDIRFRQHEIDDDDALLVTLSFHCLPDDYPPQTWFEFDSSLSANRLMSGCGMRLAEMLARHWGVTGEPG